MDAKLVSDEKIFFFYRWLQSTTSSLGHSWTWQPTGTWGWTSKTTWMSLSSSPGLYCTIPDSNNYLFCIAILFHSLAIYMLECAQICEHGERMKEMCSYIFSSFCYLWWIPIFSCSHICMVAGTIRHCVTQMPSLFGDVYKLNNTIMPWHNHMCTSLCFFPWICSVDNSLYH